MREESRGVQREKRASVLSPAGKWRPNFHKDVLELRLKKQSQVINCQDKNLISALCVITL